jgi:hypothetical protein
MDESHCIYCIRQNFSDEHYLPVCLGRFRGYEELRGKVCTECNGKCGRLDEQLCRSSSAGFFRHYLGIKGRKKHKNKPSPFYRGSAGGHRISFKGESLETGKTVELEYRDGEPMPLRHMLITTEDNSSYVLPITQDMKEPSQLKVAFKRLVGDKRANAEIYCAPHEQEWLKHLLTGLKFERQGPWTVEEGPTSFNKTEINFVVTDRFFRCLAKIGFHHLLQRMPQFTGHEEEFRDIRKFIVEEGPLDRCNRFVSLRPVQLILALQQGARLNRWGHLVAAHADYLKLTASVQLFVGPECLAPIYEISIGRNPSRVAYTQDEGSFFFYYPQEERADYDGEVEHLQCAVSIVRGER